MTLMEVRADPIARPGTVLTAQNLLLIGTPILVVALIGRMPGDDLHLRSLYQPAAFVLLAVTIGVGNCTLVGTAQALGAGRVGQVRALLRRLIGFGAVAAAVLAAICLLLTPFLAHRLLVFILSMVLVLPVAVAATVASSALRGAGAIGTSTALTAGGVLVELVLVAGAGIGAGLGIFAVPVATLFSSGAQFALSIRSLRRMRLLDPGPAAPPPTLLLRVGLPTAGVPLLMFPVSLAQIMIARPFGPDAVTAVSLGKLLQETSLAPGFAFGVVMGTLMNRALAAGDRDRARSVFRRGSAQVATGYVVLAPLIYLLSPVIAALVTGRGAAHTAVAEYLGIVGPSFAANGVVIAAFVVMQQLGLGWLTLLLNIGYSAVQLTVSAIVATDGSFGSLCLALSVTGAASVVVGFPIAWRVVDRATHSPASKETNR